MRLVILGAPRSKKNSLRRLKRGKRIFTVPSLAHEQWEAVAVAQLVRQYREWARGLPMGTPIDFPVNMKALVYRERAGRADLINFLSAVSDALERAGVLVDDRLVASLDGSRLLLDRERPRVEIELTACEPVRAVGLPA